MKLRFLVTFCICFSYQSIFSQDLSEMRIVGTGEYLESELISENRRDANGEICSGLIIITDLTGLTFDSNNGVVDTEIKQGKYFLFLSPGEQMVEVYSPEHAMMKIILNEYGIQLRSGEVWQLKLTGEKKSDLIPISIVRNINDSEIFIDGFSKGTKNTQSVSSGEHILQIIKDGYKSILDTINVTTENILFNYDLEQVKSVAVQFKSFPTSARVFLNNSEIGETEFGDYFFPGNYRIRIIKSGYLDYEDDIEIKETGENIFIFNLIKNVSILNLSVNPQDADVKIGDRIYNERTLELRPGRYNIEVFKTGYLSNIDTLELMLGDTVYKNFNLSKNAAFLSLELQPPDVQVLINKREYSNQSNIELQPGLYEIEISKNGYYPISETIQLNLGDQISKTYSLTQIVGSFRFTVRPLNAKIELKRENNIFANWEGMNEINELPIGSYSLISKAEGYRTSTKTVIISENQLTKESIVLEEGQDYVDVTFDLKDEYELYIDSEFIESIQARDVRDISIPTGLHEISLKKPNSGERINGSVNITDLNNQDISLETQSNLPTILKSALLPGLGQITSDRTTMGIISFSLVAGTAVWHYLNLTSYNDKKDELGNKIDLFNSSSNPSEQYQLGLEINELQTEVNDKYDKTKISIWLPVAAYAINLLDVLIFTPEQKSIVLSQNINLKIFPNVAVNYYGNFKVGIFMEF
ncbi:PEGA domain-containing protein [Bacteroidota bacterium]